jgi:hypothetical protein
MKALGALLILAGLLVAGYYGLIFEAKKKVGGSIGDSSLEISVSDQGREQTKKTGLMLGLGMAIGGGVVLALSGRGK